MLELGFSHGFQIAGVERKHMKKARFVIPALLAIAAVATVATSGSYTLPVPAGTPVSIHVVDALSSLSSSSGQTFDIVVAQPLVLQGWVVVQKDATGQGHVVSVNRAGAGGHEANIAVQLDWVVSADGEHMDLTAVKGKSAPLVFGVGKAYASNFQKGKDITVGPDLVFPGYTSADRVITINAGP